MCENFGKLFIKKMEAYAAKHSKSSEPADKVKTRYDFFKYCSSETGDRRNLNYKTALIPITIGLIIGAISSYYFFNKNQKYIHQTKTKYNTAIIIVESAAFSFLIAAALYLLNRFRNITRNTILIGETAAAAKNHKHETEKIEIEIEVEDRSFSPLH